jgi:hypothetical protein
MPETKEQILKHTPGPWKASKDLKRYWIESSTPKVLGGHAVAEVTDDDCDSDEAQANARLIAAAPDLLAALKQVLKHVEDPTVDRVPEWCCTLCATYRGIARDAIAKAEGH